MFKENNLSVPIESSESIVKLNKLLWSFKPGRVSLPPHSEYDYKFQLTDNFETLKHRPLIKLNKYEFLETEISKLLQLEIIKNVPPTSYCVAFIVLKPHFQDKFRLVIYFRPLVNISLTLLTEIQSFREIVVGFNDPVIFSTLDRTLLMPIITSA